MGRRLGASLAIALLAVAGCSDMGLPPPMTIVNTTDRPVEVTIVGQPDEFEELPRTLPGGGGSMLVAGPFYGTGDPPCIRGSLVATRGGRIIARNDQPCAGSRWEISEPSATASPTP